MFDTQTARRFGRNLLAVFAMAVPALAAATLAAGPALADGGVTFDNVATESGIVYEQTPPARYYLRGVALDALPVTPEYFACCHRQTSPMKPRGNPGVAIFDYDGDGDLDIYATNGPGTPNSLFSNQLQETGTFTFVDVATAAGVDAVDKEGIGVCYGDIDNDGDEDLYLTNSDRQPNNLFENNGDGTFTDITAASGADGDGRWGPTCTFGDANNDGLLDLYIGNTYDGWEHRDPLYVPGTYPLLQHNILYLNQGGNTFADVSAAAGVENVSNMDQPGTSGAAFTWATAFVDIDLDGDVDLLHADNQGTAPNDRADERGWLRLFENDGSGSFTDVTESVALDHIGGWMGLSFGDANCDGRMDFFASNFGEYITFGDPRFHSTLWIQNADGTYSAHGPEGANPFGWGNSMFDYDNDGDADIVYHGGVDILQIIALDNPGVVARNQGLCSGNMEYDLDAVTTDHRYRGVHGLATGDLNGDGFFDVVTVANHQTVPGQPVELPMTLLTGGPTGSPFDDISRFQLVVTGATGQMTEVFPGLVLPNGNLALELNSGNGNNWVKVKTRGSVGTLANGAVNRDGIGAVVKFTPKGGPTSMQPILGGSSFASEHALEVGFGLGAAGKGDLEILWPGGTRNRLRNVEAGETVLFPEIPCSYDGSWASEKAYKGCVKTALDGLVAAGVIADDDRGPFLSSAIAAYNDTH